ncbi:hypothetical protein [Orientia tsutsugamushi]
MSQYSDASQYGRARLLGISNANIQKKH